MVLKKFGILIAIVFSFNLIQAQNDETKGRFHLIGKTIGLDTGTVRLRYKNKYDEIIDDTSYIKNGSFSFSGFVSEPTNAIIVFENGTSLESGFTSDLFLESSAIIKAVFATNAPKQLTISGSHTQNEMNLLNKKKESILSGMNPLELEFSKISYQYSNTNDENIKKELDEKLNEIMNMLVLYKNKVKKMDYAFMLTHVESYLSPYLMQYYLSRLSLDSIKLAYEKWSSSIQTSRLGEAVGREINKKEKNLIGNIAQDFATNDFNGNVVQLSKFRHESYVLLDFWASWCMPCRKSNPHLRELYQRYHSKGLDIIGISCDTDKAAWIKAIEEDSIDIWHQVMVAEDLQKSREGKINESDILEKYEILSMPLQILISKAGVIIDKWYGQSEDNEADLEKKLSTIFK